MVTMVTRADFNDTDKRHFYFRSTDVFSALEVCYDNALYKFTFDIEIDIPDASLTSFR